MKKVIRTVGLASMATLLVFASSCKKDEGNGDVTLKANIPQMELVNVDGERAYIDEDYLFNWNEHDQIRVYNLSADATKSSSAVFNNVSGEGYTAYFAGPSVGRKKELGYFIAYPASRTAGEPDELEIENRETFTLAETQSFACYVSAAHPFSMIDGTSMLMALKTDNLNQDLTLHHVCGMSRIGLHARNGQDVYVKRVAVTDNTFNLTGTAQVKVPAVNTDQLRNLIDEFIAGDDAAYANRFQEYVINTLGYNAHPTGKTITMECLVDGAPVRLETGTNNTYFNFMLRPIAFGNGFTVEVTLCDAAGNNEQTLTIDRWAQPNRAYAAKPGVIKTFNYPYVIEY